MTRLLSVHCPPGPGQPRRSVPFSVSILRTTRKWIPTEVAGDRKYESLFQGHDQSPWVSPAPPAVEPAPCPLGSAPQAGVTLVPRFVCLER